MNACCFFAASLVLTGAITAAEPVEINFENLPAGPLPGEFMSVEGEFRVVAVEGKRVLELQAEPIVDGAVLLGPSVKAAASIAARVKADKSRRAFPRMGVGLYGVSGLKLRLVPAQLKLELLSGDEELASVPLAWTENIWWRVELLITQSGGTWSAEGRVWAEEAKRPAQANVRAVLKDAPGQGRGSVLGTPYANKPIQFDDVVVTDRS
jgi:hypothetical protein